MESYTDASVCADAVRSLSCSTLGTSVCVEQETYTVNGKTRYALQLGSMCVCVFDTHIY